MISGQMTAPRPGTPSRTRNGDRPRSPRHALQEAGEWPEVGLDVHGGRPDAAASRDLRDRFQVDPALGQARDQRAPAAVRRGARYARLAVERLEEAGHGGRRHTVDRGDDTTACIVLRHSHGDIWYCGGAQKRCSDLPALRGDSLLGSRHELVNRPTPIIHPERGLECRRIQTHDRRWPEQEPRLVGRRQRLEAHRRFHDFFPMPRPALGNLAPGNYVPIVTASEAENVDLVAAYVETN